GAQADLDDEEADAIGGPGLPGAGRRALRAERRLRGARGRRDRRGDGGAHAGRGVPRQVRRRLDRRDRAEPPGVPGIDRSLSRLLAMPLVLACTACAGAAAGTEVARADPGACKPSELRALFRGFQGAGDSLTGAVVVVDTAARSCRLDGSPRSVDLLDDSGDTVRVKQRAVDLPPGGPVELR